MQPKKILITGGSGFIGSHLVRALARHPDVQILTTYFQNAEQIPQDLSAQNENIRWVKLSLAEDAQAIAKLQTTFGEKKFDTIIHGAALANLATAEKDPALAEKINVNATTHLAHLAKQSGARFISFSTDQVFDGTASNYHEKSIVSPINVYGQTKIAAEKQVRQIMPPGQGISLRVSLVYGASPQGTRSASEQILTAFASNEKLRLFIDEYRTPTYITDITQAVGRLLALQSEEKPWPPLLNIAGPQRISRYEFGCLIADIFNLDQNRIQPIKQSDLNLGMPRPSDLSLDITAAKESLDYQPHNLSTGIKAWQAQRQS